MVWSSGSPYASATIRRCAVFATWADVVRLAR